MAFLNVLNKTYFDKVKGMSTATTDYGVDVRIGRIVSKKSGLGNLMDACIRRLSTPTGQLFWNPEYGYDVRQLLNSEVSLNILGAAERVIANQLELDERVDKATCQIVFNESTSKMYIYISITPVADKTFTLVLSIDKVTVELLDSAVTTV